MCHYKQDVFHWKKSPDLTQYQLITFFWKYQYPHPSTQHSRTQNYRTYSSPATKSRVIKVSSTMTSAGRRVPRWGLKASSPQPCRLSRPRSVEKHFRITFTISLSMHTITTFLRRSVFQNEGLERDKCTFSLFLCTTEGWKLRLQVLGNVRNGKLGYIGRAIHERAFWLRFRWRTFSWLKDQRTSIKEIARKKVQSNGR